MTHENKKEQGFSLVELSIVLVILGLLVGGILGGQSLIRAAEIRKISEDFKTYIIALNGYNMRFRALPGDHKQATRFWPGQTQNGNGDGKIYDHWGPGDTQDEDSKAIEHLSLAGLIAFKPNGTYFPQVVGETLPAGPFGGQGYRIESAPWGSDPNLNIYGRQGLHINAGTVCPGSDLHCGFLAPEDAWSIDAKFDDGAPATGQWVSTAATNSDCVKGSASQQDPGDNEYMLSSDETECLLVYWAK